MRSRITNNPTIDDDVLEFMISWLTQEEIAERNLRVSIIGELIGASHERFHFRKFFRYSLGVQPMHFLNVRV